MTALDAALAFEEVAGVAVRIGHDLHFDVARASHVLLDEHAAIAKGVLRLADRAFQAFLQLALLFNDPHPFTTATGSGFDQDREGDGLSYFDRFLQPAHSAFRSRNKRYTVAFHGFLGCELIAHHLHGVG